MPSKKVLDAKKKKVNDLADEFKQAQAVVFSEYRGLTVEQDTQLRNNLRKAGVTYKVVKNTLSSRAFEKAGMGDVGTYLTGPVAIAYSKDDVVSPAKVLSEFAAKNDKLKITGGWLEGRAIGKDEVSQLATIPSREVLYGQLAFSLISPIAKLAIVLGAILEQRESGEGAAPVPAADAPAAEEPQDEAQPAAEAAN